MANPLYGQNKADNSLDGIKDNQLILEETVVKSSKAITITAAANSDDTVAQPAGTTLMSVILSPRSVITTAGTSGDEASPVVGALYSATARDVHFRFTPLANDLAATGIVDVVCTFVKIK